MVLRRCPFSTSHTVTRSCPLLLRSVSLFGVNLRATMALGLPCNVRRHCPLLICQILTTPIISPLARSCPSGLTASDQTQWRWPSKVLRQLPLLNSQSLIVVLALPLNRKCPSRLKTTDQR